MATADLVRHCFIPSSSLVSVVCLLLLIVMKRLFQRLDGAGGRQSPVPTTAQQIPASDPSCVKDFIGKVFTVNKQIVVVEDVIAEGNNACMPFE